MVHPYTATGLCSNTDLHTKPTCCKPAYSRRKLGY